MIHHASKSFWRMYGEFSVEVQQRADKQFLLLVEDPGHPSLQFKSLGNSSQGEIWSARITRNYRVIAIKVNDGFLWIWAGDHAAYDRLLRGLRVH